MSGRKMLLFETIIKCCNISCLAVHVLYAALQYMYYMLQFETFIKCSNISFLVIV